MTTSATTLLNIRGLRTPEGGVPPGVVYIGRAMYRGGWRLPRSKWANPFVIDTPRRPRDGSRAEVIAKYREYVLATPALLEALPELRGKVLGCWCLPLACHGAVLVELVDALP